MKYCLIVLLISPIVQCNAQKLFIRLYAENGEKITKSFLSESSDSTIEISKHHKKVNLPAANVFTIKTRRSFAHSILLGTAIGVGAGTILFIASAATDNNNSTFGGGTSFSLALAGGAAILTGIGSGSISAALRKRQTFRIDEDINKWMLTRKSLLSK